MMFLHTSKRFIMNYSSITTVVLFICIVFLQSIVTQKSKINFIEKISNIKDFKKFVRTHTNVLVIFAQTEKDFKSQELFKTVGEKMKGVASIVLIDCSDDKKFCKKLKSSPSPIEFKHYKDGEFHKVYDRKFTTKSLVKFLQNPSGDTPWDEEESALDVVHLETKSDLTKLLQKEKKPILIMFYAPWCGFCKKLKPDFAAAASVLKGESVLAGMDVDTIEGSSVRIEYNITGFPTLIYFKNGERVMNYGGANNKDGLVAWMRDPAPAKPEEPEEEWSDVVSDVVHLTDATFDDVINKTSSVLVMFYAPWCGHCKKMKPEYQEAAAVLKKEKIGGILAALDATKHQKVAERFEIKGYPTVKYFKNGRMEFDVNERTANAIVSFMKDPKEPPPPPPADSPWEEESSYVEHLGDESFKAFIKKKKHCLVIFYAPWCGHCKKAKPEFMEAAEEFKDDNKVSFAAVDCTKHSSTCQSNEVTGYPTFKYFNYGKNDQKYLGGREKNDFISFMLNPLGGPTSTKSPIEIHWKDIPGHEVVAMLDATNFNAHILKYDLVVVTFYASACQHCVEMRKDFIEAAQSFKDAKTKVSFAAVDAIVEKELRERYYIQELPTIKVFKKGQELLEFDAPRTTENFINLVRNPPKVVVPYDQYKSDDVIHITSTSSFNERLDSNKHLFVFFHDPSNVKCSLAQPAFWETAGKFKDATAGKVLFATCDCVKYQDVCTAKYVRTVPTFNLYVDGKLQESLDVSIASSFSYGEFNKFLTQALAKTTKIEL